MFEKGNDSNFFSPRTYILDIYVPGFLGICKIYRCAALSRNPQNASQSVVDLVAPSCTAAASQHILLEGKNCTYLEAKTIT